MISRMLTKLLNGSWVIERLRSNSKCWLIICVIRISRMSFSFFNFTLVKFKSFCNIFEVESESPYTSIGFLPARTKRVSLNHTPVTFNDSLQSNRNGWILLSPSNTNFSKSIFLIRTFSRSNWCIFSISLNSSFDLFD